MQINRIFYRKREYNIQSWMSANKKENTAESHMYNNELFLDTMGKINEEE